MERIDSARTHLHYARRLSYNGTITTLVTPDVEVGKPSNGESSTSFEGLAEIQAVPQAKRVTVQIDCISAFVPSLFDRPSSAQRLGRALSLRRWGNDAGTKTLRVLHNISGSVHPGEVSSLSLSLCVCVCSFSFAHSIHEYIAPCPSFPL
jgi:hypothetical protein